MKKTQPALAGDLAGASDRRPPLVLLHGLTFDRTMWHPALAHLAELDPARQVLALDLPGHGESPAWPRYDLESLTDAVHQAVTEAGLSRMYGGLHYRFDIDAGRAIGVAAAALARAGSLE